ncbi:WhiB family transcriptional regulator [Streptomyces sp. NPDC002308]
MSRSNLLAALGNWATRGACRDSSYYDPDMFFPTGGGGDAKQDSADAKTVCRTQCPVQAECLQHALDTREPYGVWGGLTETERRRTLRRKDAAEDEAKEPEQPRTLHTAYDSNIRAVSGGHSLWTGPYPVTVDGRRYTPTQLAFIVARGREPVGRTASQCGTSGCVTGAHLADEAMRARQRALRQAGAAA